MSIKQPFNFQTAAYGLAVESSVVSPLSDTYIIYEK